MSRMSRHDEKCHNFVRGTLYVVNANEDEDAKMLNYRDVVLRKNSS